MQGIWQKKEDRFYDIPSLGKVVSVTTFLGIISKPALPQWYARKEREAVMKVFGDLAGERHPYEWLVKEAAHRLGKQKAGDREVQRAAKIGKGSHTAIEAALRGDQLPVLDSDGRRVFDGWWAWWASSGFKVRAVEKVVHSKVDLYAGTFDLWAEHPRAGLVLIDWKTSNNIWPEHHLQNRAYRAAAEEMGMPSQEGAVVRVKKGGGEPEVQIVDDRLHTMNHVRAAIWLWGWRYMINEELKAKTG